MRQTKFYTSAGLLLAMLILAGCSKDFLVRPPTDSIVDGSFYQTDDQVMAATALLYSKVWFDYNDKASFNLGDFRAGTVSSAYNYQDNVRFNTTGNTVDNGAAWRSFFNVVGQSNMAITNINRYAGEAVSESTKKRAIAEARFMRAVAYRFLVMNWGPVPIIEDNQKLMNDTSISRNTVSSIWKFLTNEMKAIIPDLPEVSDIPGRVTRWSAEGMLARFYLTRAGVESSGGQRNQQFLDSAKYFSERVITQSPNKLLTNYSDLFLFPYDNNAESLFSLQWVYAPDQWGAQNSAPAYFAYSPDIANGDGWGGDVSATWWMLSQYEGFEKVGDDTLKGRTVDQRLKATFMLPGAHYPEITQSLPEDKEQKLIYPYNNNSGVNFVAVKKYITGKAKDVGGQSASQNYGNDTYILRLAEMYLTYADAVLGNNSSTTDAQAIGYFNAIHTRAGLPALEVPLTPEMIFRERIIEFAMEGLAWYDLVSLHYYNPERAYAILNAQDRGLFAAVPDVFPNPTNWEMIKTDWATTNRTINANSGNFALPIPTQELAQAPNLNNPPVDY